MCMPLGIAAWIMGVKDLKEMDAGTMESDGRGMTQAGKICGIVAICMVIVGFIIVAGLHMLGYSLEEIKQMIGK